MTRQRCLAGFVLFALAVPAMAGDTVFFVGQLNDEEEIGEILANPGENAVAEFFYIEPQDFIQGYTFAVEFDCTLEGVFGSYDISNTFLPTIGAEFITTLLDNDPGDGDGCELIIGVLLDFVPPFDGQTLPPTVKPLSLGTFDFFVPDDVPCFTSFRVAFVDGINGSGEIPISNIAIVDSESLPPTMLIDNPVSVPADSLFVRGDANNDGEVDIADTIFSLIALFMSGERPQCLDAADVNNDGLFNSSDPVYQILFLFLEGLPPPAPFLECGLEPIPDRDSLDCDGPVVLCPFCP